MDPVVEKAKLELQALLAEDRERQVRIGELKTFLRLYESLGGEQAQRPNPVGAALLKIADERVSQKTKVLTAVEEILSIGIPHKTDAILRELERRNIEVGGTNKLVNLSVLLSRDARFVSDRRHGWSLKEEGPKDAPTSFGPEAVQPQ